MPEDILTGFVDKDGDALGRPVDVAVDRTGASLVADDVGNTIWRVKPGAVVPEMAQGATSKFRPISLPFLSQR